MPVLFFRKNKSASFRVCLLVLSTVVSACMPLPKHPHNGAPTVAVCDVVNMLVDGHANGFEKLRGSLAHTPYGSIWKARYDAIGSGCEIWQSGKGDTHYVCTRSAPDKATADSYYNDARASLRSCLDSNWQETEQPRQLAEGVKSTFSKPDTKTAIMIHEIQSDGWLKKQWNIYYIVGEPNENL